MHELVAVTKALADESRIRVLGVLRLGELCVCQIIEFLELAPSTVSKHLTILRKAGLVESRKSGRWVHFSLPRDEASAEVLSALAFLFESLDDDKQAKTDARRIRTIKKVDVEKLCQNQRDGYGCCSSARATRVGAK